MTDTKTCTKCQQTKSLEAFGRHSITRDGYRHVCRACSRKSNSLYNVIYSDAKRTWRSNNAETAKAQKLAWQRANPDKVKAYSQSRRARRLDNGVYAIPDYFLARLYRSACLYCGSTERIEADHVMPISRGGVHSMGNLVPACKSCNCSKQDHTITEWKKIKNERK